MPTVFQIGGGRPPYQVTSGDSGILPVPNVVKGNTFTVVPNNPGVIDAGLQPGELPRRTVSVDLRDSTGIFLRSVVGVAQNFLTGYGVSFTPTICPAGVTAGSDDRPSAQLCAGGETAVRMQATFNGSLAGNRQFRFEVLRGNFSFRNPVTGQVGSTHTTTSDHSGTVTTILVAPQNIQSQIAVLRVIDVATGVYADHVFVISGFSATPPQNLTVLPNAFAFKAALASRCGTGSGSFLVLDGVPPYTAVSSDPNLSVSPATNNDNPALFSLSANNPLICLDDATIVVTDARGGRGTVTVDTLPGDEEPPALAVGPTSLTLACGQSGSVAVVGGTGNYFATSTNPNVVATAGGNVVTITRLGTPGSVGTGTMTVGIGVTDGQSIVTVSATVPAVCP